MNKIKLGILYVLLIGGGIWHVLGVFDTLMRFMAAPLIIGLGIWLFLENWAVNSKSNELRSEGKHQLFLWSLFVIITSMFIEALGVNTGLIFGKYEYGHTLPPYIGGVPVAIGFAWLTMLFSSAGIVRHLLPEFMTKRSWVQILLIGLFMTLFDFFMEPAATKMGYWTWQANKIPLQNYLAWFLISIIFAWLGHYSRVLKGKVSKFGFHAYFAQLVYFVLIYLS